MTPITETVAHRTAAQLRIRGLVQGIGFRPTVWRWATELGLSGEVFNDGAGLVIRVAGAPEAIEELQCRLRSNPPPLARIEAVEVTGWRPVKGDAGFRIVESQESETRTVIAADIAVCGDCHAEIRDPAKRRHRYALTNCTQCGPRLSIITGLPYDRERTTMAAFSMCAACRAEYDSHADRRFHAEPIACPACGPRVRLVSTGDAFPVEASEPIGEAARLLRDGACVAVKGLGGYQLACDATNGDAVMRLREAKCRPAKPFALMARDIEVVRRHAEVSVAEEAALRDPAAPVVLLDARPGALPEAVAPGLGRYGFMLASTPLHLLLLEDFDTPVVMTSGNVAGAPQIIDDARAVRDLAGLATHVLAHNRPIARRVDDAVVQVTAAGPQVMRLGRGLAPASFPLPAGLENAPQTLAFGPDLKATLCLVKDGVAVVSSHQGDLDEAATFDDYVRNLDDLVRLHDATPRVFACDLHPDYRSTQEAVRRAAGGSVRLERVQHHHAHVASCLAEHGYPLDAPPVLGIALDGLGLGDDGTLWGGELMLADYGGYRRVGRLMPVAMPGGAMAAREPWRNLYAQLVRAIGWESAWNRFGSVPAVSELSRQPIATLDRMIANGINAPLSSSCGRLFDAVAAACGFAPTANAYEGEAAMRLEAAAKRKQEQHATSAAPYPFGTGRDPKTDLIEIDTAPMWGELLGDLAGGVSPELVALRFHLGLAEALVDAAERTIAAERSRGQRIGGLALTGGVLQNRILSDALATRLALFDMPVMQHARVPPGDGGLALGQAIVGVTRAMKCR